MDQQLVLLNCLTLLKLGLCLGNRISMYLLWIELSIVNTETLFRNQIPVLSAESRSADIKGGLQPALGAGVSVILCLALTPGFVVPPRPFRLVPSWGAMGR